MNELNNKPNAQKWTAEAVTNHLEKLEAEANTGDSLFLGRALDKQQLYKQVWAYWKRLFADDSDITDRMLRIENIFESKLLEGALKKEISAWVAVLTLRNNHNWDKAVSSVQYNAGMRR